MYISHHQLYAHPVPDGHRFPMQKYELLPQQLLHQGIINEGQIIQPEKLSVQNALLVHKPEYIEKILALQLSDKEQRAIGFTQSAQLIEREFTIMQGTLDMALLALKHGCGLNIAGGTHHAFADRGEGFCILNDLAIAAAYLLEHYLAKKILIIDLDVHQGNGTASIFTNESRVFTFSMHGAHNYPFHKEQSDLDIDLANDTEDDVYLNLLENNLIKILEEQNPDFAFYQCGVDVLATDKFGKMKLSMQGCAQRDEIVFKHLSAKGIPIAAAMGGGYSPQISTVVNAHAQTFEMARKYYG
jgi:acetoin utilization deacetylase AcuC-like enzyme